MAGPDHIAALAPIAVDKPQEARRLGAVWGLGHGLAVLLMGGLAIWAKSWIDVNALSAWSELTVGFLLIGMAAWAIWVARRLTVHSHDHDHEHEPEHAHIHVHMGVKAHGKAEHRKHGHAAFGIGMLHGAAGAGHLFGVLPSMALPPFEAALYLGSYFVSAILTMSGVGTLVGKLAHARSPKAVRGLLYGSGLVALVVGIVWLEQGLTLS